MKLLTTRVKKNKLSELKKLLRKASAISNDLIAEEPTHSNNQDLLYQIRKDIDGGVTRLYYVEYKD